MTETCGIITAGGRRLLRRPSGQLRARRCLHLRGQVRRRRRQNRRPGPRPASCGCAASVIKGYLNRPGGHRRVALPTAGCTPATWPRIDEDGFIYIVDRKKDMLLRGGENVYCAEVEAARCTHHPAIAECCVFGVPDARLGEEVAAAIVLRSGHHLTADELRAHCVPTICRATRSRATSGSSTEVDPAQRQRQVHEARAAREAGDGGGLGAEAHDARSCRSCRCWVATLRRRALFLGVAAAAGVDVDRGDIERRLRQAEQQAAAETYVQEQSGHDTWDP